MSLLPFLSYIDIPSSGLICLNPLQPALVWSVCVLHAGRLRLDHLSEGIPGHSVWARGDSTGRAYLTGVRDSAQEILALLDALITIQNKMDLNEPMDKTHK
jgi:hypothetical protein